VIGERIEGERSRPGRIAARLARQVELGLAAVDLTLPQYRLLMLLAHQSEGTSRLADHLAVSRPSITSVVDGLVARGLVVRRPDTGDRRRVEHVLTHEGLELLRAADDSVDARFDEIMSHLDPVDTEGARAGLDCWRRALESFRAARTGIPSVDAGAGRARA